MANQWVALVERRGGPVQLERQGGEHGYGPGFRASRDDIGHTGAGQYAERDNEIRHFRTTMVSEYRDDGSRPAVPRGPGWDVPVHGQRRRRGSADRACCLCAATGARARWEAEIDAMVRRMQTPEFGEAERKILDQPMRVPVPEHLRRPPGHGQEDTDRA